MQIWEILDHAARLYGQSEAFVCGETRLSYARVFERVRRLAAGLLALGPAPGDRIGVIMPNCHRYSELYFAADYAGLVLTPLNHRLAPAEVAYILNHAEASALVLGPEYAAAYDAYVPELETAGHIVWSRASDGRPGALYEDLIAGNDPLPRPARERGENDLAQLYYTSGTTGNPKGAMLSERNVADTALLNIISTGLGAADTYLRCAPAFHLADAWANFAVTLAGGRHVVIPEFNPQAFMEAVQRERVTLTLVVPTMIDALVNWPRVHEYDSSSLRAILFGASPMPGDRLKAAMQTFACELTQWYGMTEAYPAVSYMPGRGLDPDGPPEVARRILSCGRQAAGVQVRVVNEAGDEVRPGEVGEILIKGPNVMLGYWKRPDATAEALRGGWMHSGDAATVDDAGYIYIVDRLKDMIISGGENIYSTEVEDVLYRHPAVLECAVIGVPDEQWGERVHAIVALRPGQTATAEDLIEFSRTQIGHYKCPRSLAFIDALPKTGSGKIQKAALREPFWAGKERRV
ncbi:MAG TPA: long-chain-fatty-acid--CoA ligase [Steroidobacteraceae bacterium]|nr:long-chain-fatty-acid--CoA ligase [Steroidobacteraceae bacterium]